MIKRVILKNWRSHEETALDFTSGTNVLVGKMGSGKSSVLSGICFALFGKFPELQSKKIKLDDVIMKKPHKKSEAEVCVELQIGSDVWSVTRRIEHGRGSTAELRKNGIIVESPQSSRVTEAVESLLKMDYELFIRAVYAEQNAIDMFLTMNKEARREKIDELLKLDRFEAARSSVLEISRNIREICNLKRALYDQLVSSIDESKIVELKDSLEKNRQRMEHDKKELEALNAKESSLRTKLESLKKIEREIVTSQTKIESLGNQIRQSKAEIENLEAQIKGISLSALEVEYSSCSEAKRKFEDEKRKLKAEIENLEAQRDALRRALGRQEARLSDIRTKIDEKQRYSEFLKQNDPVNLYAELAVKDDKIGGLKAQIATAHNNIAQLEDAIKKLEGSGAKCPVCNADLSAEHKAALISEKKAEIENTRKLIAELDARLKLYEKERKDLDVRYRNANLIKSKFEELSRIEEDFEKTNLDIEGLNKKISAAEKDLKERKSTAENVDKEISSCAEKLLLLSEKKKYFSLYEQKKALLESLTAQKSSLESELEILQRHFSKNELYNAENEYQTILRRAGELKAEIDGILSMMRESEERLKEFEAKKKDLEKTSKAIEKLNELLNSLSVLEECLKDTQNNLRALFVEKINAIMSQLWPEIYPYKDYFNARLTIEGNDYILELEDAYGWNHVEGIASGGERATACLVLRIAFAYALAPGLDCLVLDEPTHNLDVNAINTFTAVLREKLTNFIDQIFVITHEPALENAVTGYLYRFERNKTENSATKVTRVE